MASTGPQRDREEGSEGLDVRLEPSSLRLCAAWQAEHLVQRSLRGRDSNHPEAEPLRVIRPSRPHGS